MSVLDKIIENKKVEIQARRRISPMSEMVALARAAAPTRPFLRRLRKMGPVALIAEVKKASPSKGVLRSDFHPAEIARRYERAGAACISVLTDEMFFQGALGHLAEVRAAVAIPVLRKDFIINHYQLYESRAACADAVLLIAAVLSESELREFLTLSAELRMDALVEVHTRAEMAIAAKVGAKFIGINNRSLSDFSTNVGTTRKLAPFAPAGAFLVSESAIEKAEDVRALAGLGVGAILVGEALLRCEDIEQAVVELMGA